MISKQYNSVGLKANVLIPQTVEEFDQLAKRSGACLESASDNVVYRGVLSGVREDLVEAVEKHTGVARLSTTTKKGDKEIVTYTESDGEYLKRVKAEKKWTDEDYVRALQPLMDTIVASEANAFDPSETVREAKKPKKLAQSYIDAATRVFSNGNAEKIAARIEAESGTKTTFVADDGTPETKAKNIELLGWSIKANEAWKAKQSEAQYA
jgi:hypothetical protein